MTYEELIKFYGTQAAAVRALGLKQPSVSGWRESGIPEPRQYQIEVLTGGALRADRPSTEANAA